HARLDKDHIASVIGEFSQQLIQRLQPLEYAFSVVDAVHAQTHQQPPTSDKEHGAVVHPIDKGPVEPVRDDVPVVSSDAPIKYSQQNIVPSSPVSNTQWTFPTRTLSENECNKFFAAFVLFACTLEQQQMIETLIYDEKFANELEVVDYSLDLVGKLDEAAKSFNIPHGQIPTSEQIMRYTFNPQWFAPVFPVKQPVSTKYSGTMPEISVIAVDVYVEYFSNDEVLL
ncbi:MAG: hypothetical protein NTW33_10965, partial [Methanoregula sp.]|nr:hypothetical protein [Methanoregula sp.]